MTIFSVLQGKLFEEIDEVFGGSNRGCTIQDVTEMNYLECCIKETLRLYPSVPSIMRCLTDDVQVGKIIDSYLFPQAEGYDANL